MHKKRKLSLDALHAIERPSMAGDAPEASASGTELDFSTAASVRWIGATGTASVAGTAGAAGMAGAQPVAGQAASAAAVACRATEAGPRSPAMVILSFCGDRNEQTLHVELTAACFGKTHHSMAHLETMRHCF